MAHGTNRRGREPEWSVVTALWIGAASIFAMGCLLRIAAGFVNGYHLRITGVYLIAAGLAVAILGWLGEQIGTRRTP